VTSENHLYRYFTTVCHLSAKHSSHILPNRYRSFLFSVLYVNGQLLLTEHVRQNEEGAVATFNMSVLRITT